MHEDSIRHHIEQATARPERETRRLMSSIVGFCWPGGGADRSEPAARNWVRRWRPAKTGAQLPVCGCAGGYCVVCN